MLSGMGDSEINTPEPNPGDWTDMNGAADLIGMSRTGLYDWIDRGILKRHYIGTTPVFWMPEVRELADAKRKIRGGQS